MLATQFSTACPSCKQHRDLDSVDKLENVRAGRLPDMQDFNQFINVLKFVSKDVPSFEVVLGTQPPMTERLDPDATPVRYAGMS